MNGPVRVPDLSDATAISDPHGKAFRDLGSEICDLERAGKVACDYIAAVSMDHEFDPKVELASYVVTDLLKKLSAFKSRYYELWEAKEA